MPGFVPSPETVMVKLHWSLHGRPQLNVLHGHFATVGPLDPAVAQNIRNSLVAALTSTGFINALASTTTFDQVGVTDLRNSSVPEILSTGTPVPGLDLNPALPDQVAFVITERTAKTGRSHRGRIYFMGYATDDMDTNGHFLSGVVGNTVAFANAIKTAFSAQGMPLAIRSPALPERPSKPGGTLPAKIYEITDVTELEARDNIPDTNRRRTDLLRR